MDGHTRELLGHGGVAEGGVGEFAMVQHSGGELACSWRGLGPKVSEDSFGTPSPDEGDVGRGLVRT